jgi:hypothetical protein
MELVSAQRLVPSGFPEKIQNRLTTFVTAMPNDEK